MQSSQYINQTSSDKQRATMEVEYHCCETGFIRITIVAGLVLFAGLMSGLTMGLMSLSLVDLEVLAESGTPSNSKHAGM